MKSSGRNILCIDDDEDTCEMLSVFLKNYKLTLAHTYKDALTRLLAGNFDGILLDSRLPDGSGLILCREIRESHAEIPIIFYSANAYTHQIEEALQAGANAYLTKPVAPEEVERTLVQLIDSPLEEST